MELTYNSVSFSLTSTVVIFLITAILHPKLLPTLIDAIKHWTNR
ncbi:hypothetical protein J2855_003660 [Agrobacterium tumefaciens]|nr:hypothetical protein [Agrobacterium tumefaciens]MBP2519468.1 hypothetical protein [Agrobacterium tumefaciens]MBP2578205.1 hypothetical protein [Agrobacterium tumefaciens]MBP2596151.1 hypothetical protein [Agrobacterium tumefaciens]